MSSSLSKKIITYDAIERYHNNLEEYLSTIEVDLSMDITWSALVALRRDWKLTPGKKYRITDYETTTSQSGTISAGHPFDVIVTALDEHTLSENASAIRSARDTEDYFGTENLEAWQLKYCLDNDTERFTWANEGSLHKAEFVAMFWDDPVNGINYDQHIGNDKIYDWGTESDPDTDEDNIVLYKTDVESFANETDYYDKYFYRGVVEVDGEEYDSWKKWEVGEFDDWVTNEDGQCQYALTERIVFDGQVIWPELEPEIIRIYDSSNCSIKGEYDDGIDDSGYNALSEYIEVAAIMMDDPVNGDPYEDLDKDIFSHYGYETEPNGGNSLYLLGRFLEDGDDLGLCEDQKYYYRGVVSVDGSDFDCWQKYNYEEGYELGGGKHKYYFLTNKIVDGDVIFTETEKTYGGKGVIYNMIDEYGNECPYDFKNIKFYHDGLGTDVYTFTWIDENYNVMDTSVFGNNGTLTYYGVIYGVYSNVIKPYMEMIYDEDAGEYIGIKQSLNNIIFISDYGYANRGNNGFYGCYNNSFGNNCYNNSFGNYCNNNSFGNYCNNNSFGNSCNRNFFGNSCYNNSFGNSCNRNFFGNSCNTNSFGNGCVENSFGNSCYNNSFGNSCENNSFGNECDDNSFGNSCYNNSFGNSCDGNSFVGKCENNSFENDCENNSFENDCDGNSFGNYCNNNSFGASCNRNSFGEYCQSNSFGGNCDCNFFKNGCHANSFGASCDGNSFGNYCRNNSFGNNCYSNSFGNECDHNSFVDKCDDNSFGNECDDNSFGNECGSNSFGANCNNNSFGASCYFNSFENRCYGNSFGNDCKRNSFGNECYNNSFGNYFYGNSFGNDCYGNSFRISASKDDTLLNYCRNNHFDDGCGYNVIWNSVQPTSIAILQNINVVRGLSGTYNSHNFINIVDKNAAYEIKVAKNSSGTIKIYCEADLIK